MIPGVNPIRFNNLEEYAKYADWSRKAKLNCPVLYYEQTYDTQNNRGFRMLNGPMEPKAGLSSNLKLSLEQNIKLTRIGFFQKFKKEHILFQDKHQSFQNKSYLHL